MTDIHAVRMLEERDAQLTALRAEIAAKDKEIADLKHDIARHLTIASDAETYAAAKDKELALFKAVENHLPSIWAIGDDATAELALGLANRDKEIARLREAIEKVLVGGNHLANVLIDKLGAGFSSKWPPTMEPQEALRTLCATDEYEVWVCWRRIMLTREVLRERSEDETEEGPGAVDTPGNTPAGARPGAGDIPEAPPEKL